MVALAVWCNGGHLLGGESIRAGLREVLVRDQGAAQDSSSDAVRALARNRKRGEPGRLELEKLVRDHPRSGWRVSVLLNLGLEYYESGQFSKCLEVWSKAWKEGKDSADPMVRSLADRAFAEWMKMLSRIGRVAELRAGLESVEGRAFSGMVAEMVQVARDALWVMENKPEVSFRCGPHALQRILMHSNAVDQWPADIVNSASPPGGIPLADVAALSAKIGMNYQMARRIAPAAEIPVPAVVHWKLEHYGAVVKKEGSRYLLDDPTFGNGLLWIEKDMLKEEGSGYFLLPPGELPQGWETVNADAGAQVIGRGYPGSDTPGALGPGHPMAKPNQPKPKPDQPKPNPNQPNPKPQCSGNQDGSGYAWGAQTPQEALIKQWEINSYMFNHSSGVSHSNGGMAVWNATLMMASLEVSDTPIGYTPPVGPPIYFGVQYNQRETNQPAIIDYTNFGPLWSFDWVGSLTFDSTTAYYNRGQGGIETFTGFDSATQSYQTGYLLSNKLVKLSATHYELRRPDGGKVVFAHPNHPTTPTRIFMTQVVDPQGNAVTLTYDGSFRLTGVTDAIGQTSVIEYGIGPESLLVKKITDPFGRFATFDYNATQRLIRITDVIGLTSEFAYDVQDKLTTLTTGYGVTTFVYGTTAGNRSVEITHPNGDKERIEQRNGSTAGVASTEPAAVVPKGLATYNTFLDGRNTFHWDRKAFKEAQGDFTRARLYHFIHQDLQTRSPILESVKVPGENRVWFNYQGQNNAGFFSQGMIGTAPNRVARVLPDGTTQLMLASYNALGNTLTQTDAAGRQVSYTYAANGLDVTEVRRKTGTNNSVRLSATTYDARHLPLTMTDTAGQTTTMTWNAAGQLLTATNALGQITTLNYNASGYLTSVDGPLAGTADSSTITYDLAGRVATTTGPDGYTLAYQYDALDRLTRVTFPDTTYEEITWQLLHVLSERDTLGRLTTYVVNSMKQIDSVTDPLGRVFGYEWCRCGDMKSLTDPMGRRTNWKHDVAGRVTGKVYPDGSTETYQYDTAGRLSVVVDAKGQRKKLQYNGDNTLAGWSYENALVATPSVAFSYDPWFPRRISHTDGSGTTLYSYHPIMASPALGAGQLASVDGPLHNDTILYAYDTLGRISSRSIGGVTASQTFDVLGRVSGATNALGVFTYGYEGSTPRLNVMNFPNGWKSEWEYFDNIGDRRLKEIRHFRPDTSPLSKHTYTYDVHGRILTWGRQSDAAPLTLFTAAYDNADRLTSFTSSGQAFGYTYVSADNRLTETIDAATATATYNPPNELSSIEPAAQSAKTLVWDAEDRLVGIDYTGTSLRTEFTYDGSDRCVRIIEKDGATVIADRRYVWCGFERCEERDASGATVLRRFFPQGEQLGSTAFFYFRDHLGSVRDVTDGVALRARYSYDPWGRRVKTSGDVDATFGFTGHFTHAPSGLALAPFRAYDAGLGRWLNRDPLGELAQGGNLFAYVDGEVLRLTDPLGLESGISDAEMAELLALKAEILEGWERLEKESSHPNSDQGLASKPVHDYSQDLAPVKLPERGRHKKKKGKSALSGCELISNLNRFQSDKMENRVISDMSKMSAVLNQVHVPYP